MKTMEIVDSLIESPLFEMPFQRKVIINRLRDLQFQINDHALKIITWPDAQEVPHWKHELTAWGNQLARMTLRTGRGLRPMGFDLPWKHLYLEPFEGAEENTLAFSLRTLEEELSRPISKSTVQIMAEYMAFIRPFCQAIGSQQTVGEIVSALGGQRSSTARSPAAAPV
jgi:hypothetical protein